MKLLNSPVCIVVGQSSLIDSQVDGMQTLEALQAGRRKRKVLSGEDITNSPPAGSAGAPGSWSRAALGYVEICS